METSCWEMLKISANEIFTCGYISRAFSKIDLKGNFKPLKFNIGKSKSLISSLGTL